MRPEIEQVRKRKTPPGRAAEGFSWLLCPKTSEDANPPRARIQPLAALCDECWVLGDGAPRCHDTSPNWARVYHKLRLRAPKKSRLAQLAAIAPGKVRLPASPLPLCRTRLLLDWGRRTMGKVYRFGFSWTTEIIGGLTIFAAMSYIILANPVILSRAQVDGVDAPNQAAVLLATCLIAGVFSILMGTVAWSPSALACGMGLNSFFVQFATSFQFDWRVLLIFNLVVAVLIFGMSAPGRNQRSLRHDLIRDLPPALRDIIDAAIASLLAGVALKLLLQDQNTLLGQNQDSALALTVGMLPDGRLSPALLVLLAVAGILVFDQALARMSAWLDKKAGSTLVRVIQAVVHILRAAKLLFAACAVGIVLLSYRPEGYGQTMQMQDGDGLMLLFTQWPERFTTTLFEGSNVAGGVVLAFTLVLGAIYCATVLFVSTFDISGTPYQMLPEGAPDDIVRQRHFKAQDWIDSREERSRRGFAIDALANVAAPVLMTSPTSCYAENLVGADVGRNRGEGVRTGIPAIIVGLLFLAVFFWAREDIAATASVLAKVPGSAIAPMLLWIVVLIGSAYKNKIAPAKKDDSEAAPSGMDAESLVASIATVIASFVSGLALGLCIGICIIWLMEVLGLSSRRPSAATTGIAVLAFFALVGQIVVMLSHPVA